MSITSECHCQLALEAVGMQAIAVEVLAVAVVVFYSCRYKLIDIVYHVGCHIVTITILTVRYQCIFRKPVYQMAVGEVGRHL